MAARVVDPDTDSEGEDKKKKKKDKGKGKEKKDQGPQWVSSPFSLSYYLSLI